MVSIFLKYGEQLIQLPVTPEKVELNVPGTNSTMDIVSIGKVTNIGLTGLKTLTVTSFLPTNVAPYVNTNRDFKEPDFYIKFINKIRNDRNALRVIVAGTNINFMCTIESFVYDTRFGGDDVYYTLQLQEFREHSVRKLTIIDKPKTQTQAQTTAPKTTTVKTPITQTTRPKEKVVPKTYTVKSGDSLWLIAQRLLGNGNKWQSIYNLNKNVIKNPNLIYPKQVLRIP